MSRRTLLFIAIFLCCNSLFGQKAIDQIQLFDLFFADTTELIIDDTYKVITKNDVNPLEHFKNKKYPQDQHGRWIVNRPVILSTSIEEFYLFNFNFRKGLSIETTEFAYISGNEIHGETYISVSSCDQVSIINNLFHSPPILYFQKCERVSIENNRIRRRIERFSSGIESISGIRPEDYNKLIDSTDYLGVRPATEEAYWNCLECTDFSLVGNSLNTSESGYIQVETSCKNLTFSDNKINANLKFIGAVYDNLRISEGNLVHGNIMTEQLLFGDSEIDWPTIANSISVSIKKNFFLNTIPGAAIADSLSVTRDSLSKSIVIPLEFMFDGSTVDQVSVARNFTRLLYTHKKLYDNYKKRGDIESANLCFVRIKDIEGRRLKSVFNESGTFKNFFKWTLNRIMKFYTNHATDPAQALVMSAYIILAFSFLYFFYPSDWDVNRKSEIFNNFRDFVRKNEKGYWRPFLKLCGAFALSFVNALALSLNSFVTLGFGNIPTRGLARYLCIIQGFTGWFLLSIFTVALFNQVLF